MTPRLVLPQHPIGFLPQGVVLNPGMNVDVSIITK